MSGAFIQKLRRGKQDGTARGKAADVAMFDVKARKAGKSQGRL